MPFLWGQWSWWERTARALEYLVSAEKGNGRNLLCPESLGVMAASQEHLSPRNINRSLVLMTSLPTRSARGECLHLFGHLSSWLNERSMYIYTTDTMYKMDKWWESTVQLRELCSVLWGGLTRKGMQTRGDVFIHTSGSMCCATETTATLWSHYIHKN